MDTEQLKAHSGRDVEYQRMEWTVQRIGWAVMVLLVLMGAVGLLGNSGPLAKAERTASDGSVRVGYYRLDHHHGPGKLTVEVAPTFVQEGEVLLWLDRGYASRFGLDHIVPEPDSVVLEPERVIYVFTVGELSGPLTITFFYEYDGFWRDEGQVGLVNGEPVSFSQFFFP